MLNAEQNIVPDTTDTLSMLAWSVAMGADEAIADEPINWLETAPDSEMPAITATTVATAINERQLPKVNTAPRTIKGRPAQPTSGATPEQALEIANSCSSLDELKEALENFDGGALKRSAKSTVFCDGTVGAPLMVVGEAPGADEDKAGKPFIGETGRLLDLILNAAGFDRSQNVYISNVIPWRPIGNKTPNSDVIAMCAPFIKRHIELAAPKVIVLLGGTATKAILDSDEGISKARGKWHDITIGNHTCAAIATYHPAYLRKQSAHKGRTWRDMLAIKHKLKPQMANSET